jgi:hypothetical protein
MPQAAHVERHDEASGAVSPAALPQREHEPSALKPPHDPERRLPPIARSTIASTGTVNTRMGNKTVISRGSDE